MANGLAIVWNPDHGQTLAPLEMFLNAIEPSRAVHILQCNLFDKILVHPKLLLWSYFRVIGTQLLSMANFKSISDTLAIS